MKHMETKSQVLFGHGWIQPRDRFMNSLCVWRWPFQLERMNPKDFYLFQLVSGKFCQGLGKTPEFWFGLVWEADSATLSCDLVISPTSKPHLLRPQDDQTVDDDITSVDTELDYYEHPGDGRVRILSGIVMHGNLSLSEHGAAIRWKMKWKSIGRMKLQSCKGSLGAATQPHTHLKEPSHDCGYLVQKKRVISFQLGDARLILSED